MKVYICGPAEPCPVARQARFELAARHLAGLGHSAVTPYTSGLYDGDVKAGTAADAVALSTADALVTLPGVTEKQYEVAMAAILGLPVLAYESFETAVAS